MNKNIGFIGGGNMGAALIRGIVHAGTVAAEKIWMYDPDMQKMEALNKEVGIHAATSNEELIEKSDIIICALKPNLVRTVLSPFCKLFDSQKIFVSVAAGVPIKTYKEILGDNTKVVRTMPNTPALVGEGMTVLSFDTLISEEEAISIKSLFSSVGKVEVLDEKLMSEVIAVTASSPAYVFMFIEAMADAAVQSGIPRALAYRMASQAVMGSAKMLLETGKHPGELKDMVCSPAGTTIEAVNALEKNGFRFAVMDAMRECTKRAKELG